MHHANEWPPPHPQNETSIERSCRMEQEALAKKKSDEIDIIIEADKLEREKQRLRKKVLLLGQSQAGKSTLLKSFQLQYAPASFRAEAEAWCAVIYLNLVHSVNIVLEVIESANGRTARTIRHLQMRLSPLRQVMATLSSSLATDMALRRPSSDNLDIDVWRSRRASGISLHSSAWRSLAKVNDPGSINQAEVDGARNIIVACKDDMVALWTNEDVQKCLQDQGVILDSQATYFLEEAGRIGSFDYFPLDDDILRARLETFGIEEHCIVFETINYGQEWVWYDIEGSRSSRAAWVPYFDDVDTVMFLVSMANFDDVLDEPDTSNFTECLRLWRIICENKSLSSMTFVLFLNKSDLLDAKLKSGIFFGAFVEEFGHRTNDLQTVSQYYKDNFVAVHRDFSPRPRLLHVQTICAIDTFAMADVFEQVRQTILSSSVHSLTTL